MLEVQRPRKCTNLRNQSIHEKSYGVMGAIMVCDKIHATVGATDARGPLKTYFKT